MRNLPSEKSGNHQVSITYGDGAQSFWLARGATLGELAIHVADLAMLHRSKPLTIDVVVEMPRRAAPTIAITPTSH